MKSLRIHGYDGLLQLGDIAAPQPSRAQLVVRIIATSFARIDPKRLPRKIAAMRSARTVPIVAATVYASLAASLFLWATGFAAAIPTFQPGTYAQLNPQTKKIAHPGNTIVLVRAGAKGLAFSVNAVRGFDMNQGSIRGVLPLGGGLVTWTHRAPFANCRLTFTAAATRLKVVQDRKFGDCGFGYGVVADGTYVRTK